MSKHNNSLRGIKKDIDYVFSAFIEDCTIVAAVNPKADSDVISGLYEEAVEKYNDLRDKAAVKVEGGKKAYFTALSKEICEEVDALYDKLSAAVKKTVAAK